jgi:hypothetical protein
MVELFCALITVGSDPVLRYTATNRSPNAVFVAHLVRDVKFKQYPDAAYTALSADGRRLNLLLSTSPLPVGLEVEFAVAALFVRLLPAESVSGDVRLKTPIDEWDAYHTPEPEVPADLADVRELVLGVDVVPAKEAGSVELVAAAPGHFWVGGQPTLQTCSVVSQGPLPVRRRRDATMPRS